MKERDNRNWFARHKVLTVILVLVGLMIIGGIAGGGSNSSSTDTSNSSADTSSSKVETPQPAKTEEKQPDVPAEYKSALNKANSYAKTMQMSKQGIYDQLVSQHGEQFKPEAAQYAVDNMKADWNANALAKAKSYQKTMSMSPSAIHDQLTSSAGEKFTTAEADYAIAHLSD